MSTLSSLTSHNLTSTDVNKVLGADQAQYLSPKNNPMFTGNVGISSSYNTTLNLNAIGADTTTSIHLNGETGNHLIMELSDSNSESIIDTNCPLIIQSPNITFCGTVSISGIRLSVRNTSLSSDSFSITDEVIISSTVTLTDNSIITLPTPINNSGKKVIIKRWGSTYEVLISPNTSETIEGGSDYTLETNGESVTFISDGTNWWKI